MTDRTTDSSCTGLEDDDAARNLAGATAVARRAREEHWTPDELVRALQMLGLDSLPPVRRALGRHEQVPLVAVGTATATPVDSLLAAVLTVSLGDASDSSVLAVLETTEDRSERVDLLTSDGVAPGMAAGCAELDVMLVRLASADPIAALDGIAARARQRGPGTSGSPEEAA